MGDNNKLAAVGEALNGFAETGDVGFIKCGIDFVKHTNRLGLERKMAITRATAVMVFSPPESCESTRGRFPEGGSDFDARLQKINITRFRRSSSKVNHLQTVVGTCRLHQQNGHEVQMLAKHGSTFGVKAFDQFGQSSNGGFKVGDLFDELPLFSSSLPSWMASKLMCPEIESPLVLPQAFLHGWPDRVIAVIGIEVYG